MFLEESLRDRVFKMVRLNLYFTNIQDNYVIFLIEETNRCIKKIKMFRFDSNKLAP